MIADKGLELWDTAGNLPDQLTIDINAPSR
jgi:hypothetical protein